MTRRGENGDEETDKSKRQHLDADAEGEDTSQVSTQRPQK